MQMIIAKGYNISNMSLSGFIGKHLVSVNGIYIYSANLYNPFVLYYNSPPGSNNDIEV